MLMPRACDNSLFHRFFFLLTLQVVHAGTGRASFLEGEGVDRTDAECDTWTFPGKNRGETNALPHPTQTVATATLRVTALGA